MVSWNLSTLRLENRFVAFPHKDEQLTLQQWADGRPVLLDVPCQIPSSSRFLRQDMINITSFFAPYR
jgi:hypothetical protein